MSAEAPSFNPNLDGRNPDQVNGSMQPTELEQALFTQEGPVPMGDMPGLDGLDSGMMGAEAPLAEQPMAEAVESTGLRGRIQEAGGVRSYTQEKAQQAGEVVSTVLSATEKVPQFRYNPAARYGSYAVRRTIKNMNPETRSLPAKVGLRAGSMAVRFAIKRPMMIANMARRVR